MKPRFIRITKSISIMFTFAAKKYPMPQLSTRRTHQKSTCSAPSLRIKFLHCFSLNEMWTGMFICKCFSSSNMKAPFSTSLKASLSTSLKASLYEPILMRIYQRWIRRGVEEDNLLLKWPLRLHHLTLICSSGDMWRDLSMSPFLLLMLNCHTGECYLVKKF